MAWLYRHLIRPWLFEFDSEVVHNRTLRSLSWIAKQPPLLECVHSFLCPEDLGTRLWGLHFPNPIGLAAGMDKNAVAVPIWRALGFGFCELGGVTHHPQPGNEAPRMFRIPRDRALINRMGFNNEGAARIANRMDMIRGSITWPRHPVGVNLGKSKITALDTAAEDYSESLRALWPFVDFFVINVSSPNTPNLRRLQDRAALDEVLSAVREVNRNCSEKEMNGDDASGNLKPVLVKIAPDLEFTAIDDVLELAEARQISGLVATNTTIERPSAGSQANEKIYQEQGGLSGAPLKDKSTAIIRHVYQRSEGRLPIIGVGGVFDADDAWEKIAAGASLVQLYTGLVYEGPGIAKTLVDGIREIMNRHGLDTIESAVGCELK